MTGKYYFSLSASSLFSYLSSIPRFFSSIFPSSLCTICLYIYFYLSIYVYIYLCLVLPLNLSKNLSYIITITTINYNTKERKSLWNNSSKNLVQGHGNKKRNDILLFIYHYYLYFLFIYFFPRVSLVLAATAMHQGGCRFRVTEWDEDRPGESMGE